jgi:outer membrane receptor for ferric coprogen and ferric-rhodotorulic acid
MDRSGSVLKPIVGSNYELGVKSEFFDGRLNAAAAIFRLEQTNRAERDDEFGNPNSVCPDWCYRASGKVISKGIDLNLNGALTPNWNIGTSYTYARAEYATGANKGSDYNKRLPKQAFRVFTSYRIPGGGWTIGGNLRVQSRTSDSNKLVRQGGYALVGLMAKYQVTPQAEINITANNLFDREYRIPNTVLNSHYGDPRSVFVSAKYQF